MKYIEEKNDLFNYEGKAWLAHCISSDVGMGKGIVVQFNERYNLKNYMLSHYEKKKWDEHGYCIPVEKYKVFNLITKYRYYQKPTYSTVRESLESMRDYAVNNDINKIAMCKIASGLDGLSFEKVRPIILDVFKDTNIKIIVCKLN